MALKGLMPAKSVVLTLTYGGAEKKTKVQMVAAKI
eukprot:CAMPEP_0197540064 /NCGR_PEP_ID=MMETSP1318-20131121/64674_1 /TAXON_ID=552666 /ORGANISM="Partenskyella glossopodia, Strain RCC365" /LENGTH=34 /DNA_ID= /DNA_START= /DNA_END= /DNA_ORIENTATION=